MPFPVDPNAPRPFPTVVAQHKIVAAIHDSIAADVDRFADDWLTMGDYCAAEYRAWLEER